MMAIPTQLAITQELDTTIQNPASRQFADGERQNIARQDEEATLVLAAECGDRHAFGVRLGRYQRRTLAVVRRVTPMQVEAADIVQHSLYKALGHLHTRRPKPSLSSW